MGTDLENFGRQAGVTCLARNPGALRDRSKHFELRWLKVQEYASEGTIDLIQVGTKWQIADALTKWLPRPRFEFLRGYLLGTSTFDHSKYPTRSH